jgi:hypothetical protein
VLARIEAELARKREFRRSGLGRDQHRSQVAEATSRASVLGGRLAEASGGGGGGPLGPGGARGPPPRAVCSGQVPGGDPGGNGPGVVLTSSFRAKILSPCCRSRFGRTSPKVESTPRVLLLPLHRHLSLQHWFACSMHMFFVAAEAQTYYRRVVKLRFFPHVSSIKTCLSVAESFIRARVTSHGR